MFHQACRLPKRVTRTKFGLKPCHFRRRAIRQEMVQRRKRGTLGVPSNLTPARLDPGGFHLQATKERLKRSRSVVVDRPHLAATRAHSTGGGNLLHLSFNRHLLDLCQHRVPIFQKQTDPFRMQMFSSTTPRAETVLCRTTVFKNCLNRNPEFHTNLPSSTGELIAIGSHTPNFFPLPALIPEGSTLFIDTGTTTIAFARELVARGNIRVITNSFEIARIMSSGRDCDILLLGGRPHRDVPATYGEMTLSQIDRFLADFAVISPVGLHPDRGVTDYELHEAEVARAMMRRAQSNILLCDSGKIGAESRVSICRLEEISHLVTDRDPRSLSLSLPRGTVHFSDAEPGG